MGDNQLTHIDEQRFREWFQKTVLEDPQFGALLDDGLERIVSVSDSEKFSGSRWDTSEGLTPKTFRDALVDAYMTTDGAFVPELEMGIEGRLYRAIEMVHDQLLSIIDAEKNPDEWQKVRQLCLGILPLVKGHESEWVREASQYREESKVDVPDNVYQFKKR